MRSCNKALLTLCGIFIIAIGSLIFILPQKDFSESENRYLAKMPRFSLSSLLEGNYTKELSSFYSDQFPLRRTATSLYSVCERSLGKRNIGGVILYKEKLVSISKKETNHTNIPIPAVCVKSKYELFAENADELSLYYNTDHHRSTYGAYLLYLEACDALDIEPYPESYFQRQTVCTDFYGTDFFKSLLPRFMVSPDSIELWRYSGDDSVTLTICDTGYSKQGLYDTSKLDTADKYAVFLGGNYAVASVTSSPDKPTLLLFKDSFANAVVPFLALHFNIDLVDPRYATQSQIYSAYHSNAYSYRLFIGCLDSFN